MGGEEGTRPQVENTVPSVGPYMFQTGNGSPGGRNVDSLSPPVKIWRTPRSFITPSRRNTSSRKAVGMKDTETPFLSSQLMYALGSTFKLSSGIKSVPPDVRLIHISHMAASKP